MTIPLNKLNRVNIVDNSTENVLLTIDVTKSESHGFSSRVTEHPLENGSSTNDHVILNSRQLELNCIISNDPIEFLSIKNDIADLVQGKEGTNNMLDAYGLLYNLWKSSVLLNIVTGLEYYKNYIITNVSIPRTGLTTNCLEFSITFKEIVYATTKTEKIVPAADTAEPAKTQEKKKTGTVKTQTPTTKVSEKGETVLNALIF